MERAVKLHPSWRACLGEEFAAPYMTELRAFLRDELASGYAIFPPPAQWFAALDATPLDQVRVVILGQDPYHGEGQAHGLAFSVAHGVRPPPSLVNIFKELEADLGEKAKPPYPLHGNLASWARQGVLLLNTALSVRLGLPGSHAGRGWERFTDAVIACVAERTEPTVFILWGRHAQAKAGFVDRSRHCVIASAHPSPLSARTGFFGSKPFSRANDFLVAHGRGAIDWVLPQHRPGGGVVQSTPPPRPAHKGEA